MPAILELSVYALAIVCLGLAAIITVIIVALFKWLVDIINSVPFVNIGTGWVDTVNQSVLNALGRAFAWTDHMMGASLHLFANYMSRLWDEIKAQANLTLQVGEHAASAIYTGLAIKAAVKSLTSTYHTVTKSVGAIERDLTHLEHRTKVVERDVAKGIGDDVLPRLKSLDKELAHVTTQTIPALVEADNEANAAISDLWTWARQNVLVAGTVSFAGAVALALSTLGLGGLRCPSLLGSLSKRGCGLWNGLEDLLGLLFDAVIFLDLCHIIPTIEGVFADFEQPLTDLISAAANAACAQPSSGWVTLPAPSLSLPTPAEITAQL